VVTLVRPDGTETGPSLQAAATPQVNAVGAPTGLAAAPGESKVKLSWQALPGVGGYNLHRSSTVGGVMQHKVIKGVNSGYVDQDVTNGTTYYYYYVAAVNAAGAESAPSAQSAATPNLRYPHCNGMEN